MNNITAKIIGFSGRDTFLLMQGQAVKVRLEGAFQEGQEVTGQIVKNGGRLTLQAQQPKMASSAGSLPAAELMTDGKQVLSEFFRKTGVPATELNFLTAFKALQLGQPLGPELFHQVQRYMSFLPDKSENSLHVLLFSLWHGLPLHRKTILTMKSWLDKGSWKGFFSAVFARYASQNGLERFLPQLSSRSTLWRQLLNNLGFQTERRLLQQEKGSDLPTELFRAGAKDLAAQLKEFVSFLKVLNAGSESEEPLLLLLPYLHDGEVQDLILKAGKKPDAQGEFSHHLEIYLSLSALGDLALFFSLYKNCLRLDFLCQEQDACDYLQSRKEELAEELSGETGFQTISIYFQQKDFSWPQPLELKEAIPMRFDIRA